MTPFIEQYYEKSIRIAPDGFSFFKQNGEKMETVSFSYADNTLITNEAPRFFNTSDEKIYSEKNGSYRAVYFLTKNEKDTLGRLPFRSQTTSENSLFYRFLCQQKSNDSLFVSRNPGFTDVMAVHKGEILMTNRFQLVEPADTLYYIYNIVTQFHLQDTALYLHFFAEEDKKLTSLLKTHKLNLNII